MSRAVEYQCEELSYDELLAERDELKRRVAALEDALESCGTYLCVYCVHNEKDGAGEPCCRCRVHVNGPERNWRFDYGKNTRRPEAGTLFTKEGYEKGVKE